jgi:hypothetical protein
MPFCCEYVNNEIPVTKFCGRKLIENCEKTVLKETILEVMLLI